MREEKITAYILIILAVIILLFVMYRNSQKAGAPIVFSDKDMFQSLWSHYKQDYLEKGTLRSFDTTHDDVTTSEGQSYTLLRAVWMDDRATFDTSFQFTQDNLKHKNDNLYSWLFGKATNGQYRVLTEQGGGNSASDADTDIALALVFAYYRWGDQRYLDYAQGIFNDIWAKEVVVALGKPYLAANDIEKIKSAKPLLNPSYLAPYAYRIFHQVDDKHDWLALVDTGYEVLTKATQGNLDKGKSANLPPNWVALNPQTGAVEAATGADLTTNFGFDALRVPFRIALDYEWFSEPRAKEYLDSLGFFKNEWQSQKALAATYSHDGQVVLAAEVPSVYGGVIGYFKESDGADAEDVYGQKLKFLFNQDTGNFKDRLSYYDANWAWFGIGLYNNFLPNLASR